MSKTNLSKAEDSSPAPDWRRSEQVLWAILEGTGAGTDVERRQIESVLHQTHWMIEGERGAAKILNLNPSTRRSPMKNLGIKRPDRVSPQPT